MGQQIPCKPLRSFHEWEDCPLYDEETGLILPPNSKWRRCAHCGARQRLPQSGAIAAGKGLVRDDNTSVIPIGTRDQSIDGDLLNITIDYDVTPDEPRKQRPDLATDRVLSLANKVACFYPTMTYVQLLCDATRGVVKERDGVKALRENRNEDRVVLEDTVEHIARVTCFDVEGDITLGEWVEALVESTREENILLRERAIGPRTVVEKAHRTTVAALVMIVGFCGVIAITMLTIAGLLWLARALY